MDEDSGMLSKMLFLLMILVKTSLRRMRPSFDMVCSSKNSKHGKNCAFDLSMYCLIIKSLNWKKMLPVLSVVSFVTDSVSFPAASQCETRNLMSFFFFFFSRMTMKKMFECCNVMWSVFNDPFLVLANIETNGLCQQGRYIRRTDLS